MGRTDSSDQFRKIIIRHKFIGYNLNVMLFVLVLVGWDRSSFVCCLVHRGSTDAVLLVQISSGVVWQSSELSRNALYLLSPRLCFLIVFKRDSFGYRDDSLTSKGVSMRTEQPTKCFAPLQKLRVRSAP